jgi:hypothetical protein
VIDTHSSGKNILHQSIFFLLLTFSEAFMDVSPSHLILKRSVNVKAIVTPRWKEEAQQQLQAQINQVDNQLQQLEMQAQRMISEIQKQSLQLPGPESAQQIESIQVQVNQKKSELLEQKNQVLQQLQQVQILEMDQEVNQGQIDSVFRVELGDNLIEKMQVELLLRDGMVEEIRGMV